MIEWARIKELRREIGDDDFNEVAELFLEESDAVIARISVSAGAPMLEANLHFLKGAALNLGFRDFAALCQHGERQAALGNCDVDLGAVIACYHASKRALLAGEASSAAA